MYCTKCGKELFDEAVVCPNCGCKTENYKIEIETNDAITDSFDEQTDSEPLTNYEEAQAIFSKITNKMRINGFIFLLAWLPIIGSRFGVSNDYLPYLLIIAVGAVIATFVLCFKEVSVLKNLHTDNVELKVKIEHAKNSLYLTPWLSVVIMLISVFVTFIKNR